ncbi:MAG TPA: tripartite tricarboxylate transporter substrate binding protein [Burkholderiales bacterium]|jgi:tripartite-type tricarboxylate transporter receptor subunit TctC|nr:tripartite tricarboxylate transporter substrate binding protein [Burkholderiales bacterium]
MSTIARLSAAAILCAASAAFAQEYPSKPIRFIVPLTPGSGADILGRIVAKHMSDAFKQPVLVENRPGAGGIIGTQAVLNADADGYTLMVQSASHAANPAIYKALPYDPLKDIVDVAMLGMTPYVMIAAKAGAYPTLQSLIAAARAKPGEIPFASAGVGTSTHMAAEYVAQVAGVKMLHIPYKGSPEAIQDTIAGRTSFYMAPLDVAIGHLKEGKIAPFGVSTAQRSAIVPDIPTLAEQGLANYNLSLWFGMWARAGTSPAVIQKLNAQVTAIGQSKDARAQLDKLGITPVSMRPDEFGKFVREQMVVFRNIAKQANIQPQ